MTYLCKYSFDTSELSNKGNKESPMNSDNPEVIEQKVEIKNTPVLRISPRLVKFLIVVITKSSY